MPRAPKPRSQRSVPSSKDSLSHRPEVLITNLPPKNPKAETPDVTPSLRRRQPTIAIPSKPSPVLVDKDSPWKHPDELEYITPDDWSQDQIIAYLCNNGFSIPPRGAIANNPWVKITGTDRKITILPRRYRVPLLFVAKFQWQSLRLVMLSGSREEEWDGWKYDILHVSRLCTRLLEEARKAMETSMMDRGWRCSTFDRALTRYYQRWLVSREEFLKDFWIEFEEEEYEKDVLKNDWGRWVLKGHKGFHLTKEEVQNGLSFEDLTQGLGFENGQLELNFSGDQITAPAASSITTTEEEGGIDKVHDTPQMPQSWSHCTEVYTPQKDSGESHNVYSPTSPLSPLPNSHTDVGNTLDKSQPTRQWSEHPLDATGPEGSASFDLSLFVHEEPPWLRSPSSLPKDTLTTPLIQPHITDAISLQIKREKMNEFPLADHTNPDQDVIVISSTPECYPSPVTDVEKDDNVVLNPSPNGEDQSFNQPSPKNSARPITAEHFKSWKGMDKNHVSPSPTQGHTSAVPGILDQGLEASALSDLPQVSSVTTVEPNGVDERSPPMNSLNFPPQVPVESPLTVNSVPKKSTPVPTESLARMAEASIHSVSPPAVSLADIEMNGVNEDSNPKSPTPVPSPQYHPQGTTSSPKNLNTGTEEGESQSVLANQPPSTDADMKEVNADVNRNDADNCVSRPSIIVPERRSLDPITRISSWDARVNAALERARLATARNTGDHTSISKAPDKPERIPDSVGRKASADIETINVAPMAFLSKPEGGIGSPLRERRSVDVEMVCIDSVPNSSGPEQRTHSLPQQKPDADMDMAGIDTKAMPVEPLSQAVPDDPSAYSSSSATPVSRVEEPPAPNIVDLGMNSIANSSFPLGERYALSTAAWTTETEVGDALSDSSQSPVMGRPTRSIKPMSLPPPKLSKRYSGSITPRYRRSSREPMADHSPVVKKIVSMFRDTLQGLTEILDTVGREEELTRSPNQMVGWSQRQSSAQSPSTAPASASPEPSLVGELLGEIKSLQRRMQADAERKATKDLEMQKLQTDFDNLRRHVLRIDHRMFVDSDTKEHEPFSPSSSFSTPLRQSFSQISDLPHSPHPLSHILAMEFEPQLQNTIQEPAAVTNSTDPVVAATCSTSTPAGKAVHPKPDQTRSTRTPSPCPIPLPPGDIPLPIKSQRKHRMMFIPRPSTDG